jgi:hypothetical protein
MNAYHDLVSDAFSRLNTLVHPTLYPFVLGQTLHAVRVSIVFQSAARRSSAPLSWGKWIVGYLMIVRNVSLSNMAFSHRYRNLGLGRWPLC